MVLFLPDRIDGNWFLSFKDVAAHSLFSSGLPRRLRWTDVITLISLISLLFLNYSHMTNTMTTTYFEIYECPVKMGATSLLPLHKHVLLHILLHL